MEPGHPAACFGLPVRPQEGMVKGDTFAPRERAALERARMRLPRQRRPRAGALAKGLLVACSHTAKVARPLSASSFSFSGRPHVVAEYARGCPGAVGSPARMWPCLARRAGSSGLSPGVWCATSTCLRAWWGPQPRARRWGLPCSRAMSISRRKRAACPRGATRPSRRPAR